MWNNARIRVDSSLYENLAHIFARIIDSLVMRCIYCSNLCYMVDVDVASLNPCNWPQLG